MKKLVLSSLLLVFAAVAVQAQPPSHRGKSAMHAKGPRAPKGKAYGLQKKAHPPVTQLYDQLNLNTTQRTRAEQLNRQYQSRLQNLSASRTLSPVQKQQQLLSLTRQQENGFQQLLSPRQSQQYDYLAGQSANTAYGSTGSSLLSTLGGALFSLLSGGNVLNNAAAGIPVNNFSLGDLLANLPLDSILSILLGGGF